MWISIIIISLLVFAFVCFVPVWFLLALKYPPPTRGMPLLIDLIRDAHGRMLLAPPPPALETDGCPLVDDIWILILRRHCNVADLFVMANVCRRIRRLCGRVPLDYPLAAGMLLYDLYDARDVGNIETKEKGVAPMPAPNLCLRVSWRYAPDHAVPQALLQAKHIPLFMCGLATACHWGAFDSLIGAVGEKARKYLLLRMLASSPAPISMRTLECSRSIRHVLTPAECTAIYRNLSARGRKAS